MKTFSDLRRNAKAFRSPGRNRFRSILWCFVFGIWCFAGAARVRAGTTNFVVTVTTNSVTVLPDRTGTQLHGPRRVYAIVRVKGSTQVFKSRSTNAVAATGIPLNQYDWEQYDQTDPHQGPLSLVTASGSSEARVEEVTDP